MKRYNPARIEPKWQKIWDDEKVYQADLQSSKPKYLAMSMFNYPSGTGIHIGHAMNYTISDVKARFKRQQGYESYHPVGWDAFGLPAENFAIKSGVSPQQSMEKIIPGYHKQYKAMGWSNDWSKEIATHEPQYYRWTQWIFSQMFKQGLAYQDSRMQWWCEKDNTVLANEQIVDGKCWRHDGPDDPLVKQKEVKQWFFKITEYADELLDATDALDWSDVVKTAQKNWIGRSIGAEVDFELVFDEAKDDANITVFTTRPDTLFGATFMVLAPEHDWVAGALKNGTIQNADEVNAYLDASRLKSELERQANTKDKSGVQLQGVKAKNPLTGDLIPLFVADYVLPGYGTGAIMAVPAHDERDYEFAVKYNVPVRQVIAHYKEYDPRDDVETIERKTIDVILRDEAGHYLLEIEGDKVHFVGGGVDPEDATDEDAVRREVLEETGYTDIASIRQVAPFSAGIAYRHTKNKNQKTWGAYYEVVLASKNQVRSEIEDGKHAIEWVSKEDVEKRITWEWHLDAWSHYLAGNPAEFYDGEGILINSGAYNGISTSEAREQIVAHLEREGKGHEKVNYRMRDWSVSRQRYWGAPIPIIHCEKDGAVLVPDEELPVILPELVDFAPSGDGRSALARATDWLNVECPECGGPAQRETDTLDTYICSSWYMFRYLDPHNDEKIFDSNIVNKWAPVDFYNGGDHATAHLLYARFVTRFFTKIGIMENPEPFKQMLFNGKVMASDGSAFSKSKGNGIDPLEIISSGYGADALRTYLMFAAPLEFSARWDPQGVPGTHRFLSRIWGLVQEYLEAKQGDLSEDVVRELRRSTHAMIKKATIDVDENRYNTAIAATMAQVNTLYKLKVDHLVTNPAWQEALEALVAVVAPFAPHIADELWHQLGRTTSVQHDSWPVWNEEYLSVDTIKIVVQVNGKVRAEIEVNKDVTKEDVEALALANERIQEYIAGKKPARVIYVPGRLVNVVV